MCFTRYCAHWSSLKCNDNASGKTAFYKILGTVAKESEQLFVKTHQWRFESQRRSNVVEETDDIPPCEEFSQAGQSPYDFRHSSHHVTRERRPSLKRRQSQCALHLHKKDQHFSRAGRRSTVQQTQQHHKQARNNSSCHPNRSARTGVGLFIHFLKRNGTLTDKHCT